MDWIKEILLIILAHLNLSSLFHYLGKHNQFSYKGETFWNQLSIKKEVFNKFQVCQQKILKKIFRI